MGNCETKKTSDAVDMEIDGIEHVKPKPSAEVIHGLICLAAQLAFDVTYFTYLIAINA